MDFIHRLTRKLGILPALRFIASGSTMSQFMPTQNPIDGSQRGQWPNPQLFQLPLNRLSPTKQSLVVQAQPYQLHCLHCFIRHLTRIALWTPGLFLRPSLLFSIAFDPLIDPGPRIAQRLSNGRNQLSSPITFNGPDPVLLLFSVHRWLLSWKLHRWSNKRFQRSLAKVVEPTVNNVVAFKPVNDVLAFIK